MIGNNEGSCLGHALRLGILFLTLLHFGACFSNGGGISGNTDEIFEAVIGQQVTIFNESGQAFQEPINIQLITLFGQNFDVPHMVSGNNLLFRVPPVIPTGFTTVKVSDGLGRNFEDEMIIRRLGVIANRGGDNLIIFDVDDLNSSQSLSL